MKKSLSIHSVGAVFFRSRRSCAVLGGRTIFRVPA